MKKQYIKPETEQMDYDVEKFLAPSVTINPGGSTNQMDIKLPGQVEEDEE